MAAVRVLLVLPLLATAGSPALSRTRGKNVPISGPGRVKQRLAHRLQGREDDGELAELYAPVTNSALDPPARFDDVGEQVFTELTAEELHRLRLKKGFFKKVGNFISNTARKVGTAIGLPVKPPAPGGITADPDIPVPQDCQGNWKTVIPANEAGKELAIYVYEVPVIGAGAECPVKNGEMRWQGKKGADCVWGVVQKNECENCQPGILKYFIKSQEGSGGRNCNSVPSKPPGNDPTAVEFENTENPCPCKIDCVGRWEVLQPCKPCEPGVKQWKVLQRKQGRGEDCQDEAGYFPKENEKQEIPCGCNKPCEEEFSVTECEKKDEKWDLCTQYTPWFCKYLQTATYKVISPARGSGKACTFAEPTTEFIRECPKCQVEGTCDPKDDIGFIGAAKQKLSSGTSGVTDWLKSKFR